MKHYRPIMVNGCCCVHHCPGMYSLAGSTCPSKKLSCCLRFYPRMMTPTKQKSCVYCFLCVLKCLQPVGQPSFEDVKHLYPRDLPCIHGLLCRPAQVFTVGSLCVGVSGKPIPTWQNGAHGLFQYRPQIWLRPLSVVYTLVESHAN